MSTNEHTASLGRAHVTLAGVLAQSLGFMGPVFSVAALLPLIVGLSATGRGAGVATPVAILIAGVGIFGAGWIIAQYAKRIHLCGSVYEYVCDGAGPRTGVVMGWLYYGAMLVLSSATLLVIGGLTSDFLASALSVSIPWWVLSLVYLVGVVALLVVGVQISILAQLALVLVSAAAVLGFSIWIILRGGAGGDSLSLEPFNPRAVGGLGLLYGILYGINMFIGFESAANLAEETENPKRDVPRAVVYSLLIVGVYFLVVSYSQAVGFGLDAVAWKESGFPLQALASGEEFGSAWFGNIMAVIVILDILAVCIGVGVAVSRGMMSMARSGRLPLALSAVHPKFRTPIGAIGLYAAFSFVSIVLVVITDGIFSRGTGIPGVLQPQWAPAFGWMAGFGGTGLAVMYMAVSLAGLRGLWNEVNRVKLVIAALAGVLVSLGAVFGAVYKAPSPLNTVPWALGVWLLLGLVWSYVALNRAPAVETADILSAP
ncbi:MAG: APC family permease [Nocardioides sp.]|uniref:APC family permease n=1 Tax=Nocardioides sp. TaxID=35761 RepID=UPI003267BD57